MFGRVGKGNSNCDSDGDGNSHSGGDTFNNQQTLQAAMECRGGLTAEEGAMMMMTESTNVPFGWFGKGDGDCDSNGDSDSESGGNTFNHQQMLQVAMQWRVGRTVKEGAMMTRTELTNVLFGQQWQWQWRGDGNSGGIGRALANMTATTSTTAMVVAIAMATAMATA